MHRLAAVSLAVAATARAAPAGPEIPDAPEVPHALGVTVSASSTAKGHDAAFVVGTAPAKFWCEGKAGDGVGESIVLEFAAPARVTSLTIRAGVWQSPELFRTHDRVTELHVTSDEGLDKTVKFREERENVDVSIGRTVGKLRLEIAAVAKGKIDDTCISGIDVHTDPAATVIVGLDAGAAGALEPAFAAAWHALASCDDAALKAQVPLPFTAAAHRYTDAKSLKKGCKDGAFIPYLQGPPSLRLAQVGPGKVMYAEGPLEWHFALSGKTWRLIALADHSR